MIDRRELLVGGAVLAAAACVPRSTVATPPAAAVTGAAPPRKPGSITSFGPLKQIAAGELDVGDAEAGPADGPPVILLHGWPYDIHSFVDVAPMLAR